MNQYQKDVSDLDTIDVYKIADLYGVNDNRQFHALKKILCAGTRGAKGKRQDMEEAKQSIQNWLDNDEVEIDTQDLMVAQAKTNYPWAKWIAQNSDGNWYAYNHIPFIYAGDKWTYKPFGSDNRVAYVGTSNPTDWKNSLRKVRD